MKTGLIKTRRITGEITLHIFFMFLFLQSTSQDPVAMHRGAKEATLPTVVMPSPNSASLVRSINENVDLYTGRLNVSIPLYTLKARNIEIPISIQLSANAHKVDDIGSWVGLGAQLNAGGVITRVMRNLPDEYNAIVSPVSFNKPGYGYLSMLSQGVGIPSFADESYIIPYGNAPIDIKKDIIHRGSWTTSSETPDKCYDLQPDEFFFQFGRYSGKFVFDQSGKPILITESNIKITPVISSGKITAFTITGDDGFVYEFGNYSLNAVEETKFKNKSWSVTYAYRYMGFVLPVKPTVQGDILETVTNFYSQAGPMLEPAGLHVYEKQPYVISMNAPDSWRTTGDYEPPYTMDFANRSDHQKTQEYFWYPSSWYLTKITSPTGDIVAFTYADNGTLTYLNDRSVAENRPIFQDSYYYPYNPFPDYTKYPSLQTNSNFWTFKPLVMNPVGLSLAQPKEVLYQTWCYPSFGSRTYSESTIELRSKRLTEIHTSQGYRVIFTAQTTRQDFTGDKRLDKITIQNNGILIKELLFDYDNIRNTESFELQSWLDIYKPKYYYTRRPDSYYDYKETKGVPYSLTYAPVLDESLRWRMYLKSITEKGANLEQLPPYLFDYTNKSNVPFRTSFRQDKFGFIKTTEASDPNIPDYTVMKAGVLEKITYPTGGYKQFQFEGSGVSSAWNGLRIKEIKEYPSSTATPIVKTYSYGPFIAHDASVIAYVLPDVIRDYTLNGVKHYVIAGEKNFWTTKRVNPVMGTHGAAGGYSWAEISQTGNGKYHIDFNNSEYPNLHTPTYLVSGFSGGFIKNINSNPYNYWYPFPQLQDNDWQRGLPKFEYYEKSNGLRIKETEYQYDFANAASGFDYSAGLQTIKYRIDYGTDWNWLMYGRYMYYPKWQLLKTKIERTYAANGINYLEQRQDMSYKKLTHNTREYLFPSEIITLKNSKNEQTVKRMKYPLDYSSSSDEFGQGIAQLKTKNILNAIIEQYVFLQDQSGNNKRYIGGLLNKYHSDKPLLKQAYSFQPATSLSSYTESNIVGSSFSHDPNYIVSQNFSVYDNYGNIKQQSKQNDIPESYLWGYNQTFPVAKAINAASTDIAYTSFEDDNIGSNWTFNAVHISQITSTVTGKKFFVIPVNDKIVSGTLSSGQSYKVTFWSKMGDPILIKYLSTGGTQILSPGSPLITVNGWKYYEMDINNAIKVEVAKNSNVPTVYIDELRLFPKTAQMTTYTFDPSVGMTSECDPNNRIVYYEYDGLQRLQLIKDQNGNVIKTFQYNYKQ